MKSQDNAVASDKFRKVAKPILNQYIVVFNDDQPREEIHSLASNLTNAQRGKLQAIYSHALKGFSIHGISEAAAIALSNDPRVEFVEENCEGRTGSVQTVDYSQPHASWHLDRIDQRGGVTGMGTGSYTYNQTGTGVHAYVLDSGIRSTHTEFGGRVVFDADYGTTDPTYHPTLDGNDCEVVDGSNQGHGTQVAGAVGASTYGVAKNVTLHNIRVCNCNGQCPSAQVIQGVDYVTANHTKPAVVNMSIWMSPSTALEKAIRKSQAAGVTYVVIAGNGNGADASGYTPARMSEVITVASSTIGDARETTSNTGAVVDLYSPGYNTPSPQRFSDIYINDYFQGTSSAAPKVAGAAAMYLESDTKACPCTISKVLTDNASVGYLTDYDPFTLGTPNKLLYIPPSWPSPTYYSLSLNGTSAYANVPTTTNPSGVTLNITGSITVGPGYS